jgi:hypothetical protein
MLFENSFSYATIFFIENRKQTIQRIIIAEKASIGMINQGDQ